MIAQFRDDAAAFFGNHHVIDVQQLQTALAGQTFEDNISGLRRAVFKACLNGLTDHEANVAKQQKHDAASPTIQAAFGFLPWLDKNGQFRTMQAIEEDMVRLAHTHFKGRLGRMAKGLGWGRTTLYRRLQSLEDSLSQAAPTSDTQEGDLIGLEDQTAEHMGDMGSQIQAESDVRAA